MSRFFVAAVLVPVLAFSALACTEAETPTLPIEVLPSVRVEQTTPMGFLPPLGPAGTESTWTLPPDSVVEVRICHVRGDECANEIAVLEAERAEREYRQGKGGAHFFMSRWNTHNTSVPDEGRYRISVHAGGCALGDVDVLLRTGPRSGEDDDLRSFRIGQTVPIRYWVDEDARGDCATFELVDSLSYDTPTLHVNPGDPILLTEPSDGGEFIQYLVEGNADATLRRVRGFARLDLQRDGETDFVLLDESGRLTMVQSRNGTSLQMEYFEDDRVRATLSLGGEDAGQEFIVFFNLNDALAGASVLADLSRTEPVSSASPRMSLDSAYVMAERKDHLAESSPTVSEIGSSEWSTQAITADVFVSGAENRQRLGGAVVDGRWRRMDEDGNWHRWGLIPFWENEPGRHVAHLSVEPGAFFRNVNEFCAEAADRLAEFCQDVDVAYLVALWTCSRLTSPHAVAACMSTVTIIRAGCTRHDFATNVCQSSTRHIIDRFFDQEVGGAELRVGARLRELSAPVQPRHFEGTLPGDINFEFTFPLQLTLRIWPPNPYAGQGYNAITQVHPAARGITINTSVSGSDGFTRSRSGPTNEHGIFEMFVPGAEAGVEDVITTEGAGRPPLTTTITFGG